MINRSGTSTPQIPGSVDEWTQVGGLRVRFCRAGSGSPLVLVHGLLGYSFNWRHVIPQLAKSHEVFVPDLPGSGFSDCSSALDCRLSSSTDRLLEFLNVVGIKSCDLVGHSYGGAIAMLATAREPSRVRRLVLVSPANPWSRIGRKRVALLHQRAIAACFPTAARWAHPLQAYFVRRMYGDPRRLTAEALASHLNPLKRVGVLEHGVAIVKTWWDDMAELQAALSKIPAIPILLVWGSLDKTVDPASAALLGRHLPPCRIEVVDGAGHLPFEECPEEFCRIVLPFLGADAGLGIDGKSRREVT
jgi:pimeloyl-ACP methyl ester carboxylesterase